MTNLFFIYLFAAMLTFGIVLGRHMSSDNRISMSDLAGMIIVAVLWPVALGVSISK